MPLEATRAKIISSIWQGIAQSGVDLQSIPAEQQGKLVEAIASASMVALNQILDELPAEEPAAPATRAAPVVPATDVPNEEILWKGRPFLSLTESYIITTERIKIIRGLVGRDIENFELIRVQDIDYGQSMGERMFGIGDLTITGADASKPTIVLRNVEKPEQVYEILRRAWLEARKRYGLQFREYM